MRIGPLTIAGKLFLAPMADITDLAFRLLCKKYGASMVFSEMTDADGIINRNMKAFSRLVSCDDERPYGIQLAGASVLSLERAAVMVEERYRPDLIDINFGCPSRRVRKNGCGAALLGRPQLMQDIISKVSHSVSVPVTAKMRMYEGCEKTIEVARMLDEAGAAAITIHARTPDQTYAERAKWDVIREMKKELHIPVIANGDITDGASARQVMEDTGCDGIMIGRAAIGNPYIFRQISHYLSTGECLGPLSPEEQLNDFFEYVDLLEKFGMLDYPSVKLHAKWFTKGIENGKQVRIRINAAWDVEGVMGIMGNVMEQC